MVDANSSLTDFEVINRILDSKVVGVPVWQTLFLVCGIAILFLLVLMCCCISFRIPRTKQEIEADYIRKQITRKFRKQLDSIPDSHMDEMDLSKAIEKVRFEFMSQAERTAELRKTNSEKSSSPIATAAATAATAAEATVVTSAAAAQEKSQLPDKTWTNSDVIKSGTSEEKLMERGNSLFGNKLVTIVNAFTVLCPKKVPVDGNSKQMTV